MSNISNKFFNSLSLVKNIQNNSLKSGSVKINGKDIFTNGNIGGFITRINQEKNINATVCFNRGKAFLVINKTNNTGKLEIKDDKGILGKQIVGKNGEILIAIPNNGISCNKINNQTNFTANYSSNKDIYALTHGVRNVNDVIVLSKTYSKHIEQLQHNLDSKSHVINASNSSANNTSNPSSSNVSIMPPVVDGTANNLLIKNDNVVLHDISSTRDRQSKDDFDLKPSSNFEKLDLYYNSRISVDSHKDDTKSNFIDSNDNLSINASLQDTDVNATSNDPMMNVADQYSSDVSTSHDTPQKQNGVKFKSKIPKLKLFSSNQTDTKFVSTQDDVFKAGSDSTKKLNTKNVVDKKQKFYINNAISTINSSTTKLITGSYTDNNNDSYRKERIELTKKFKSCIVHIVNNIVLKKAVTNENNNKIIARVEHHIHSIIKAAQYTKKLKSGSNVNYLNKTKCTLKMEQLKSKIDSLKIDDLKKLNF